jgi:hypothetical protein
MVKKQVADRQCEDGRERQTAGVDVCRPLGYNPGRFPTYRKRAAPGMGGIAIKVAKTGIDSETCTHIRRR